MNLSSKKATGVAVTITSDLMCPWCWIGLEKLQQASRESRIPINITWKPFLLRPSIPETTGQPKGGTPSSRVGAHMYSQGKAVGIDFTGLTDHAPNSVLFHATLKYLQDVIQLDSETVTAFHVDVFEAYFTLGIFPGTKEGILKNVKDPTVRRHVEDLYYNNSDDDDNVKNGRTMSQLEQLKREVVEEAKHASLQEGVTGVPTFAFGGDKAAFSGAQHVDTFARYLNHYASAADDDFAGTPAQNFE